MNNILARLKEPSTFRGLAVLGGLVGLQLSPTHWDSIATAVGAVLGLVEVFRKEK
jgi:uncharacterized protein YcfJ